MLPLDYSRDVFVQRCSLDNGRVDSHGVIFLDLCKQTGLRIFNGRCDNDKRGNYTHVGSQGSSVVDYVIVTQILMEIVSTFQVGPNILSDHCIIDFTLMFDEQWYIDEAACICNNDVVNCKYVWDDKLNDCFQTNFSATLQICHVHLFTKTSCLEMTLSQ